MSLPFTLFQKVIYPTMLYQVKHELDQRNELKLSPDISYLIKFRKLTKSANFSPLTDQINEFAEDEIIIAFLKFFEKYGLEIHENDLTIKTVFFFKKNFYKYPNSIFYQSKSLNSNIDYFGNCLLGMMPSKLRKKWIFLCRFLYTFYMA